MQVLLVPNYSRPDALDAAHQLDAWLDSEGIDVSWACDPQQPLQTHIDISQCSLVVSLGGDGTLLRAAHIVGTQEIPILGLSFGHLGFLTGGSSEHVVRSVADALAGDMVASRRATLEITVDGEDADGATHTQSFFALNELALTRGAIGDLIEFDVSVSGNHVDRLRGDGFVVATATGSTGYALAAGGPIVTPSFVGTVCVPIAPHTILARAFLTAPSDIVEIAMSPERPVERIAYVDGRRVCDDLRVSRVTVRRGLGDIILLDSSATSFYDSVSRVFYGRVGPRND